jgi:hypothetical protein
MCAAVGYFVVSQLKLMRRIIAFLFGVFWTSQVVFGAEPTAPIYNINPEDVVRESIRTVQIGTIGTNTVAVFFTYTEAGAKKMLDFQEAHAGQKMRTRIGDYLRPEGYAMTQTAAYERWKEGWLKWRTSKFYGVSEAEAKAIVTGLKGKAVK